MGHRTDQWDDEPIGDLDLGFRRRWRRAWHHYAAIMLGFVGFVLAVGSVRAPGLPTLGAALVLLSPWALTRADGPRARAGAPPPPPPPLRDELCWTAAALALAVVGAGLFAV
ncbi:hypothetical protein [Nocardioides flavescens]|uniref:Uncharacterized protein n=1 Tax=Nocardioides flavescens TaxID=2691959 RepID=A0A6L7ESQ2_9ACTN|nr:hypothetical protein [Nocardioides flavescens]MXG89700.1 hypothetical protein [Nocardioides flavescens]